MCRVEGTHQAGFYCCFLLDKKPPQLSLGPCRRTSTQVFMNKQSVGFSLLLLWGLLWLYLWNNLWTRQGCFLLKASSKGCLPVIAPGVWQPHLVFLLGSLASASTRLQMAAQPFLQLSGGVGKGRCGGMEKCGWVRIQLSCCKAAHTWSRGCTFTTEIDLCSPFVWAKREARLEAEAWSCVLCGDHLERLCMKR